MPTSTTGRSPSSSCKPSRTTRPRTRSSGWRRPGETYVTDGEQRESSFATYPITTTLAGTGLAPNLAGDGQFFAIFDDGHHRQLPRLTGGPFRYQTFASEFVEKNKADATNPVKQAVIAPSMLLYPLEEEIEGYSREQFLSDLCDEVEKDIRQAFAAGAQRVSIDFTEGRFAKTTARSTASRPRSARTSASTPAPAGTTTRCTAARSP